MRQPFVDSIAKWEPFQWLDLKGRKRFVIFTGVILLWNFIALLIAPDDRLSSYLFTLLAAALFGWALFGLKLGFDKQKKENDIRQEDGKD